MSTTVGKFRVSTSMWCSQILRRGSTRSRAILRFSGNRGIAHGRSIRIRLGTRDGGARGGKEHEPEAQGKTEGSHTATPSVSAWEHEMEEPEGGREHMSEAQGENEAEGQGENEAEVQGETEAQEENEAKAQGEAGAQEVAP